jgi:hypothetical protein
MEKLKSPTRMGKILSIEAFIMSTALDPCQTAFHGWINSLLTTMVSESLTLKINPVYWQDPEKRGRVTRASNIQMTQSQKLKRLNEATLLNEYVTDLVSNWISKIWSWK